MVNGRQATVDLRVKVMSDYKPKDPPESILDIFLHPGEYYWGEENTRIRTLLGSCVSVALWHPVRQIGGMTHIMLPDSRGSRHAKFADVVIDMLLADIQKSNSRPSEFIAKVFGGGHMFSKLDQRFRKNGHVGQANVDAAFKLLNSHGFKIVAADTGGYRYRKLIFDIWSGDVYLQRQEQAPDWVDADPDEV